MRPGSVDPGNAPRIFGQLAEVVASMRPGSVDPGNLFDRRKARRIHRASMRPGSVDPGNCSGPPFTRGARESFNEAGIS